jgi:hypothetical protein
MPLNQDTHAELDAEEERCPLPGRDDMIARYSAGSLTPQESDLFEVHLIGCATCQADVRLAAAIRAELRTRTQRRRRFSSAAVIAAAAAVVAIVLVPGVRDRSPQVHRSDRASTEPTPLSPTGEVAHASWLKWTRVPEAAGYNVKVFTADGTLVWDTRAQAESVAIQPLPLQRGNDYFWIVAAELHDGSVLRSAATRFRLKR